MIIISEDSLVEKLRVVIQEEIHKGIQKETRSIVQEEIQPLVQRVSSLENKFDSLHSSVANLEDKFDSLHLSVANLEVKFDSLHLTVARMEVDFGDTLKLLCDYAKSSIQKDSNLEYQLEIQSKKLENHSMRIANLEDFQKEIINQK